MSNIITVYFNRHPLTTFDGAFFAIALGITAASAYRATQGNTKYHTLIAAGFGLLAASDLAKEKLI